MVHSVLRCAVIYRLEDPNNQNEPPKYPTILACSSDQQLRFAVAGSRVIHNIQPGEAPQDGVVGGFKVVVDRDHHQLVYGVDREGICYCVISGDNYPPRIGILFLVELAKEFNAKFGGHTHCAADPMLSKNSKEMLTRLCDKYRNPYQMDRVTKVMETANRVKSQLQGNFDKVISQTASHVQVLAEKSEKLHGLVSVFKKKQRPATKKNNTSTAHPTGNSVAPTVASHVSPAKTKQQQPTQPILAENETKVEGLGISSVEDEANQQVQEEIHQQSAGAEKTIERRCDETPVSLEHSTADQWEKANHSIQVVPGVGQWTPREYSASPLSTPSLKPDDAMAMDDDIKSLCSIATPWISHPPMEQQDSLDEYGAEVSIEFDNLSDVGSHYLGGSFGDLLPFMAMPTIFPYHEPTGISTHWRDMSLSSAGTDQLWSLRSKSTWSRSTKSRSVRSKPQSKSIRGLTEQLAHDPQFLALPVWEDEQSPSKASAQESSSWEDEYPNDTISVPRYRYEHLLQQVKQLTEENQMLRDNYITMEQHCSDLLHQRHLRVQQQADLGSADSSSIGIMLAEELFSEGLSRSARSERRRSFSSHAMREIPEVESDEDDSSDSANEKSDETELKQREMCAIIRLQALFRGAGSRALLSKSDNNQQPKYPRKLSEGLSQTQAPPQESKAKAQACAAVILQKCWRGHTARRIVRRYRRRQSLRLKQKVGEKKPGSRERETRRKKRSEKTRSRPTSRCSKPIPSSETHTRRIVVRV